MIRGFFWGGIWGAVVGAIVLALTSQLADWRDLTPAVAEGATGEAQAPVSPEGETEKAPSVVASVENAPQVENGTPQVDAGAADEISAPMLDTSPPTAPAPGEAAAAITAEVDVSDAPERPADVDAPGTDGAGVLEIAAVPDADTPPEPGEPALAPASSAPDATAEIAPPQSPEVSSETETVALPEAEDETDLRIAALPATEAPEAATDRAPATPSTPEAVADAPEVAPAVAPETVETSDRPLAVVVEDQPQPVQIAEAPSTTPSASEARPQVETEAPATAVVTGSNGSTTEGTAPQVIELGQSEPRLPGAQAATLPRIGDTPSVQRLGDADDGTEDVATVEPTNEAEAADAMPAVERNRTEFEAPDGAGLIAVVLFHETGVQMNLPQSDALPVPLTVAVPASGTDAAEAAATYRSGGYEVVLIPDLPPRATAKDVEVALPVNLQSIPQAVAIMDLSTGGFQDDRGATESVLATLSETGHGILTWRKGLNTAQKLAVQEGIPSAEVFRELEADTPDAVVRALDQAAFRARQEGGIVVVANGSLTIISGLAEWASETRRDTALAPLSAVLTGL